MRWERASSFCVSLSALYHLLTLADVVPEDPLPPPPPPPSAPPPSSSRDLRGGFDVPSSLVVALYEELTALPHRERNVKGDGTGSKPRTVESVATSLELKKNFAGTTKADLVHRIVKLCGRLAALYLTTSCSLVGYFLSPWRPERSKIPSRWVLQPLIIGTRLLLRCGGADVRGGGQLRRR